MASNSADELFSAEVLHDYRGSTLLKGPILLLVQRLVMLLHPVILINIRIIPKMRVGYFTVSQKFC